MHGRTAGYTLTEMLVTLVIIGLTSAMMLSGLGTARRVWEHSDVANAAGEAVSGTQMVLRERLERSFPETRYDKTPTYAAFDGLPDKIMFVAPPRDIHAPSGLQIYTLGLAGNGDFVMETRSELATDPTAPGEQRVLLHNVQQLDIAYYGVLPGDKAAGWHDRWENLETLPRLVRIRVQFPPDDPRIWPELLIKPFATVDSMCVLMVMTGKCRGRQ